VKRLLAVLVASSLLLANVAQAIEIRQFDKLAGDDQIDYVSGLVASVEAASSPAELPQVKRFFRNKQPGQAISGMGQFELDLARARVADLQNAASNPRIRPLEVEDVLYVTLQRNGIVLPESFRPAAVRFRAKLPPRTEPMTRAAALKALADTEQWVARTVEPDRQLHPGTQGMAASDSEKAIAFFAALAALAVAADRANPGSGSGGNAAALPVDSRPWWEQNGYNTYQEATNAACRSSHIPSMTGGYSGIC